MSGLKKRKVDSECRVFNKEWTTNYFFTEVRSTAVCLICQETVAVFKEYNISRHFTTKHANYASKQSPQELAATAQRLTANLQSPQELAATAQRLTANLQTQQNLFTDKLRFKSQVLRQVFCWHSN